MFPFGQRLLLQYFKLKARHTVTLLVSTLHNNSIVQVQVRKKPSTTHSQVHFDLNVMKSQYWLLNIHFAFEYYNKNMLKKIIIKKRKKVKKIVKI